MKHIFSIIALIFYSTSVIFLSGCSIFFDPPKIDNVHTVKVNPEAERLVTKAKEYWQGKEQCFNVEQAITHLDQALKIDPEYTPALFWRGLTLSYAGYHEEALEDLTAAIRQNPAAENYTYRGLVMFRLGNNQGALKDLNQAIALDKTFGKAFIFRAGINLQQQDLVKACADFIEACEQNDCSGLNLARKEGVCK